MLQKHRDMTSEVITAASVPPQTGLFLVFAHTANEQSGGWKDFIGAALSVDQAKMMIHDTGITYGATRLLITRI